MKPRFFRYFARSVRLEKTPDGRDVGIILNNRTGRFEEAPFEIVEAILGARTESDISVLRSEDDFIRATEEARRDYLRGEGPIFALYDTISAIFAQRREEQRRLTPEERALIATLYKRTFKMWEDEFARQDAGQPPSFSYRSTL
ncbi:hypothetical protein [Nocardia cyriacigeorgica]|uniref:hypothetical protein n=1 Tax=Nocardia cyriacigeorgica TaxID=135487 RepID=UPI00189551A1|nr:hypothetical protein [Nocardia cyriacigeorgica]MBF6437073.1 hypothetical protein [Nocardia cyriacigeorgica]MBF6452643.1 hypothetical protein [Nocardia cyriacigeorgica]MBF6477939.1 hypothetical protein [Nocardia cyriacigeorgica]MBF6549812.1 hypothetical protein [Nocardia cyriacigeorgica]